MLIDTPWTKLSGVVNPDVSAWKLVVFAVAMLLLIGPLIVWRERWVAAWRWWKSVLFFVGFFCIALPVVAGGAGAILGDNHAKVDAADVVAQVLSARPSPVTKATAPARYLQGPVCPGLREGCRDLPPDLNLSGEPRRQADSAAGCLRMV